MLFTDKIFSQIEINEPIILELIKTPQMQRLKKIHQYGVFHFFLSEADTTRFEHSLGVYWLLKHFAASREEQIAGLLHDISHGPYSHVIDRFYGQHELEDHQDAIHHQFFKNNEVSRVLKSYQLDPARIANFKNWPLLDQPLPNICADRLQYTLADAVTINKIDSQATKKFIENIFIPHQNGVGFIHDNQFIFKDKEIAKEFAELSLWMCSNFWHADWGVYSFHLMIEILQEAIKDNLIAESDFLKDEECIDQLLATSKNKKIIGLLKQLKNLQTDKVVNNPVNYEYFVEQTKFRVIDPLVKINNQIKRISEMFPDFKEAFNKERERVKTPKYFKYVG